MIDIKSFTMGPFSENTYLLYNENKNGIIVDPGMYDAKEDEIIFEYIAQHHLNITQIINTHAHLDHVFGVPSMVQQYQIPFAITQAEQDTYNWAAAAATKYGLHINTLPEPNYYIKPNDTFNIDTDVFKILDTPGHSPGHVCFYNEAQQFLIAGDAIFQMSIGRTDLPGGNHAQLINSITAHIFGLPDATIIYSGHGPSTTVGFEKMNNPYLR
jgi:hydroxyacylglutathione hydrolase